MSGVYGLVVCGGRSSRMGHDKSLLDYHGVAQREWVYGLLESVCDKVFLSCNEEQGKELGNRFPVIQDADTYKEIGPMAALLSAWEAYPESTWLVVGCDYPYLSDGDVKQLSDHAGQPAAFYNKEASLYEPLLGLYPPTLKQIMQEQFAAGNFSLQAVLKKVNAEQVIPKNALTIKSVDTEAAYLEAKQHFSTPS